MKPCKFIFSEEMIMLVIVISALSLVSIMTPAYAGSGWGSSTNITGAPILVPTYYANSPSGLRPDPLGGPQIDTGTPLRKFVDTLPGLGAANANNLGQYIPVAVPEKWVDGNGNVTNDDYYEIAVVEYTERMHSDLFKPTRLRGYVQLETPGTAAVSKHVPLKYPDGTPILDIKGMQVYAVDNPHYLGPLIHATRGVGVRIKYTNYLPVGNAKGAHLFLPVDYTLPGGGIGPDGVSRFTENRADIHLHGGDSPWISDGTPHHWISPAGETGAYSVIDPATGISWCKGVSVQNVPDMPDPGPGSNTLYYPNAMSARFMFFHDHTSALTRLNVYAGLAAGYLITDPVEQGLVTSGVIPAAQIPVIIEDKTFVPKDVTKQDAKWDPLHWGQEGDLWYPHVYETNQDPNSFDGTNPPGRWDWGPWFWPVFPAQYSLPSGVYGDVSTTPEAYMDTPVINGTAYPTITVDPKAYRFRILNASNDRFINLSLFVADPTIPATDPVTGAANPGFGKEVKMVPAIPNPAFPATWPTDGRAGGVPDPALAGPDIIEFGNEGGFLPHPEVVKAQPVTYEQNRRSVTVLNVLDHGIYLGPAERSDAVIDFSQFAGKTLILYNDGPAPNPAFDPRNDYFTGDGDQTAVGGAYNTLAGYGPNTRTIMQIKVRATAPAAPYNLAVLQTALPVAYGLDQDRPIVAESAYNTAFGTSDANNYASIFTGTLNLPTFNWTPTAPGQVITGVILTGTGTGYTSPPTVVFNGGVDLSPAGVAAGNAAATAVATVDPVTKKLSGIYVVSGGSGYTSAPLITFTGGGGMGATAVAKTSLTQSLPVHNKAIQELFEPLYGRMNATLGVELPFTTSVVQTTVPLGYIDPTTESIAAGETQIWKITHNGVDSHPVHIHLINFQLINRIGWDGTIKPPNPTELGWKDTITMNPLEDVVVAVRGMRPQIPFGLPQSVRPLDPAQPLGSTLGFMQVDLTGDPTALPGTPGYNANWGKAVPAGTIKNALVNFDNEYVWHCHILGHEENDFMRPFVMHPNDVVPDAPRNLGVVSGGRLTWVDPTPTAPPAVDAFGVATLANPKNEIGFNIMRSTNGGPFAQIGTALANATSWTDTTWAANAAYSYNIVAYNAAGSSLPSNTVTLTSALLPTALTFAPQQVGLASPAQVATLTNLGAVALPVTSIAITGPNAADFAQTNNCGTSLGTGTAASCTINVTFTPSVGGIRNATLTVVDAGGTQTVALSGTGALPTGTLTPASPLTFAAQQVGTTSAAQTMTLTNTGAIPLTVSRIAIWGTNIWNFAQTNTCGTSVAVGGSCTISVVFKPNAAGARTAMLTVVDGAATRNVTLNGTGATAGAALTPATGLAFGAQLVGAASAAQVATLTNTGTVALPVSSITLSGANAADFAQTNNCGTSVGTGATASCTINVTFKPSGVGAETAALTVVDAAGTQTVTLTGTGAVPAGTLTPASPLTFAAQAIGSTSAAQTLTLSNTGAVPLAVSKISIWGTNIWNFAQTNTCGTSVPVGGSCTISVVFQPNAAGTRTATLTVVDAAATRNVTLNGTGATSSALLTPALPMTFAAQQVGTVSAAQVATLSNWGSAALPVSSITITGANATDFAQTNNCGTSVGTGAAGSCSINVTFNPGATGARTATLTVVDAAGTQTVTLNGTGALPAATLTPATSVTFAAQTVGTSSMTQMLVLTNTGSIPLSVNKVWIWGTNIWNFAQTNTCGTSVPVGGSCTISVVFQPNATGIRTAMLTVTDAAATRNVTLTGTGI